MSFLTGLMDVLASTANARVRQAAQKSARRAAGKQQDTGCTPCAANAKVMARYEQNQQAARAKR